MAFNDLYSISMESVAVHRSGFSLGLICCLDYFDYQMQLAGIAFFRVLPVGTSAMVLNERVVQLARG